MYPDAPVHCCLAKRMVPDPRDGSMWHHTDQLVCIDVEDVAGVHLGILVGSGWRVLCPEY